MNLLSVSLCADRSQDPTPSSRPPRGRRRLDAPWRYPLTGRRCRSAEATALASVQASPRIPALMARRTTRPLAHLAAFLLTTFPWSRCALEPSPRLRLPSVRSGRSCRAAPRLRRRARFRWKCRPHWMVSSRWHTILVETAYAAPSPAVCSPGPGTARPRGRLHIESSRSPTQAARLFRRDRQTDRRAGRQRSSTPAEQHQHPRGEPQSQPHPCVGSSLRGATM